MTRRQRETLAVFSREIMSIRGQIVSPELYSIDALNRWYRCAHALERKKLNWRKVWIYAAWGTAALIVISFWLAVGFGVYYWWEHFQW